MDEETFEMGILPTHAEASPASQSVPEIPNFITLIANHYKGEWWAQGLHEWENVIFVLLISILVSLLFYLGSRRPSLIPHPLQNFLEWFLENLYQMIGAVVGKTGEKYIPFLGTLFIYILAMNWFGLVPFMKSPSSSLNTTIALAICVFLQVQYLNIKNMGVGGFLYHMAGSPKDTLGWIMSPLLLSIEIITQISRPVTLSLRLFGNILGEHILIGAFALLGITMLAFKGWPIGIPLQTPFLFLSILTSLMQALVFTLLSSVYIFLSDPHSTENP